MVCSSIFSLFLSRILVVVFSSLSKEMYLHGSIEVEFYIATFQREKMIHKTSFLNHESLWHPLKIFKLLNKREEQRNNVEKTAVIFPRIFYETLGALVCLLGIREA